MKLRTHFMHRFGVSIFAFVLGMSVALAEEERQNKPGTLAEKYQTLLKERETGFEDLSKAQTAEERKQLQARLTTLPLRFVELAEQNPKDPVALEALIQTVSIVNGTAFPEGGKSSPGERALVLLMRDHVLSDKLGPVCQHVLFGFHKSHETFLRAVLEVNPHRQVQALACLSLAQYLDDRCNRLDVLQSQDQPDLAERYYRVFGKDYMEELQRRDRTAVAKEAEMLLTRAVNEYSDVEIPVTLLWFGRHGRRQGQDGTVQDPAFGRGQGGTGDRGRRPGRKAFQADRLPRQSCPP